jgi:hypothetical protein
LEKLANNEINSNVISKIRENVIYFIYNLKPRNYPIEENEIEEIQGKTEQIIEKCYKD